jgi:hypothetical protein
MPREPIQLLLFRLDPEALPTLAPPVRRPRKPAPKRRKPVQLVLQLLPGRPHAGDEDDTEYDYPTHRMVKADEAAPVRPTVARSIFDLGCNVAELQEMARMLSTHGRTGHAAAFRRVDTGQGAKVVGAQYPAYRMTPEREEAERVRRAKQRPPKPSKTAKTRGTKVRAWDGEEVE